MAGIERAHAGIMNSLYIIRSILECADRKLICEQSGQEVCNLEPSVATVVLILSILTSAASLGYKAARNVCILLPLLP